MKLTNRYAQELDSDSRMMDRAMRRQSVKEDRDAMQTRRFRAEAFMAEGLAKIGHAKECRCGECMGVRVKARRMLSGGHE